MWFRSSGPAKIVCATKLATECDYRKLHLLQRRITRFKLVSEVRGTRRSRSKNFEMLMAFPLAFRQTLELDKIIL